MRDRRGAAPRCVALALAGCTTIAAARGGPGQRLDPWETWNRKVFDFNEDVDQAVLKPVATAYTEVVPQPVRTRRQQLLRQLRRRLVGVNNVLQGKFEAGVEDVTRVSANTLFGLVGLLDVATEMGIEHHYEDFGQTLGRWGVGAGAYLVLPLLGPSTVRDAAALPLDRAGHAAGLHRRHRRADRRSRRCRSSTRAPTCSARASVLDDIALDKYTFMRDAYLQRRRSLVFDGNAPETPAAPDAAAPTPPAPPPARRCRRRGSPASAPRSRPIGLGALSAAACSQGARIVHAAALRNASELSA